MRSFVFVYDFRKMFDLWNLFCGDLDDVGLWSGS